MLVTHGGGHWRYIEDGNCDDDADCDDDDDAGGRHHKTDDDDGDCDRDDDGDYGDCDDCYDDMMMIQSGTHLYVEMEGREGLGCAQLSITQVDNFIFLHFGNFSILCPKIASQFTIWDQQSVQLSQGSVTAVRAWDITISQVICPGG